MSPREKETSQMIRTASRTRPSENRADNDNQLELAPTTTTQAPLLAACRHLLQPNGSILGRDVAEAILPLFPTVHSAIPTTLNDTTGSNANAHAHAHTGTAHAALASTDGRAPIAHERIAAFVQHDFCAQLWEQLPSSFRDHHHAAAQTTSTAAAAADRAPFRIALVLPNGPELALAILAVAQWASCVPLSAAAPAEELRADLSRCGADFCIFLWGPPPQQQEQQHPSSSSLSDCARDLGIPFCFLVPSRTEAGIFTLQQQSAATAHVAPTNNNNKFQAKDATTMQPNGATDEVLVLFTSGTTGNKKLVPHCLGEILTAAATIALSWDLTPSDVNCNMMPLFHGAYALVTVCSSDCM